MSIKLTCDHCGKRIEAPDSAGGKWGKCPKCHAKLYVPEPVADEDELRLAPLDESEIQKQQRLMAETFQLTREILEERATPEPFTPPGGPGSDISEEQLTEYIIRYLRQMADSKLDEAQRTADQIVPHRRKANAILERLAKSDTPEPELEDIPQKLLLRLIGNLRTRIS
jgi:hypothetical protein